MSDNTNFIDYVKVFCASGAGGAVFPPAFQ